MLANADEVGIVAKGGKAQLHPRDEMVWPREVDGEVRKGAFFHGMQTELGPGQISCGFVFRCVTAVRDVECAKQCVIPTRHELEALNAHMGKGVSQGQVQRQWAGELAGKYANSVRERVRKAISEWPWWERPPCV